MSIHILFADGSNPYIRYNMTPEEFAREILKWSKSFELLFIQASGTIFHFKATEKGCKDNGKEIAEQPAF